MDGGCVSGVNEGARVDRVVVGAGVVGEMIGGVPSGVVRKDWNCSCG